MPMLATSHDASKDWPIDPGLIDTRQAMPLWQDGARYLQALQRFASAHAAWQLPEGSDKAAPVMPALQEAFATAHRIKGAAANLGLTRIITAAAELESQARLGKPDGAQQAWQALHQAFHDTLPEIARLSARREEGQPLA